MVEAAVAVPGGDRARLEPLCRSVLRAAGIRVEIERLREEFASACWRGAAAASSHDPAAQNLRKTVAKNIRSALNRIQAAHEPLWRYLYAAVRTGIRCS